MATSSRAVKTGPRVSLRDRRARRNRLWLVCIALLGIALIGASLYAIRLPQVTLTNIVVSGQENLNANEVTTTVGTILDGSYLLVIPKRFALIAFKGGAGA